jgi:hypothetical protein
LPYYFSSARRNIVFRRNRRSMLSSYVYPKATFVRDAFYGPLALNDIGLSYDCYQWFLQTQNEANGQIRTAVPFDPANEPLFTVWDDDSSMLFIIWSAWLRRNRVPIDLAPVQHAFAFVQSHVHDDQFVSPASSFCYWADTVKFEVPERVAHNQGLYALTLRAMQFLDPNSVTDQQVVNANAQYASFFRADIGAMMLGKDSWWANKLDISVLFPEFMLRWLYDETAVPDNAVQATVEHFRQVATVITDKDLIVGVKAICEADGAFLPPERFFEPSLNGPGHYQNGGYWPMYTLIALALAYRVTHDLGLRKLIEHLVTVELGTDRQSKELIILAPDGLGAVDPNRSSYTWNALIVPALKWARVA